MATKNDATGAATAVEFNGDTYQVPPAEDWDLDVLEAIDDSKMTLALRALLGDEQYAKFRATNKKVRDLGAFFEAAGKSVGAGNS
ncbi:hypothetical protein IPZ61_15835 [Streptomyces sioyaensis]|uniref:hypothetical protein n=1 Tax=Streptomyces sioyaensis TaxID=67364 RepID=UPI001F42123A|nr:hypothetical protein [Streptomyces sioyaensis]MCF3174789.1 hypothetical protein [Streptomyces sioyaensis]